MRSTTYPLVAAAIFAALTAIGAYLRIPLPLVPITLQTFFVILSGFVLGPVYGAVSQLIYLAIGLIGFPVFAEGGGLAYIFKPTFGYLIGFTLAAAMVGWLAHRRHDLHHPLQALQTLNGIGTARLLFIGVVGMLCIFIPGVLYLYIFGNRFAGLSLTLSSAIYSGFIVFIPGDLIKLLLVITLLRALGRRVQQSPGPVA